MTMTPVGKHECDQLKEYRGDYEIVKFWDDHGWVCIDYTSMNDGPSNRIKVNYCFLCGEQLATEKEMWYQEKENIGQE